MNLLDAPLHLLFQKVVSKHSNARKGGLDSDLSEVTLKAIIEIVGDGLCYYTKQEFSKLSDATFERVNPSKGYVKGNVVMVRTEVNNIKGVTLDRFVKDTVISDEGKLKLLRKAVYQLEKKLKA